jgi:sterol desaturase/sphingolipid hydroxylase (fatty acid hydroxylase superfamily)
MKVEAFIVPAIFLAFALVELLRTNFFHKLNQTRADAWVEGVGSVVLLAVTQPAILLIAYPLMALIVPDGAGAAAGLPILAQIALFLVFDDMVQYWWHRASHSFP